MEKEDFNDLKVYFYEMWKIRGKQDFLEGYKNALSYYEIININQTEELDMIIFKEE